MAYCVKCGVELDGGTKKCPLCGTPVYMPDGADAESGGGSTYADQTEIPRGIKRRFVAFVVSMIMLLPNIVLFLVNAFFVTGSWWSVYVVSSTALTWILFVLPFLLKKPSPYILWALDASALAVYAYVFFVMRSRETWSFGTVFASLGVAAFAALIFIWWIRRKKHHWTAIISHLLADLTAVSLLAGLVSWLFSGIFAFFAAGLICAACFIALMGFFLYCNKSRKIREWFNKAFHL